MLYKLNLQEIMAVQASKSISLTDLATGEAFKLSANQILNFTAINAGADTQLTYIGNRGTIVVREVAEAVATVNTAAARTQAVTLTDANSTVIYLHSDKIIFMDDLGATTQIIYNGNENYPKKYIVTENASAINTVAENTFAITIQASGLTRYINNLFVADVVTGGGTGSNIIYNAQGTAFQVLQVAETAAQIQTAINAL